MDATPSQTGSPMPVVVRVDTQPKSRSAAEGDATSLALKLVTRILDRSPFKEHTTQIDFDAFRNLLNEEFAPQTFIEKALVADIARLQIQIGRYARSVSTFLVLQSDIAAREIVVPGYSHFVPGGSMYRPSTMPFEIGLGNHCGDMPDWSANQARDSAVAKLASEGISQTGIQDVAVMLNLQKLEQVERLTSTLEARRDRLYDDLVRAVEKRKRLNSPVQILDAEFQA